MAAKELTGAFLKPKKTKSTGVKQLREEMGRFICKHRLVAGKEQWELSEELGYNYNVVLKWETAARPYLYKEDADKLVKALSLPEDALAPYEAALDVKEEGKERGGYRKVRDTSMGARLEQRLKEVGLTPSEFARALDQYPQHINGYLKGTNEPRLHYVKRMVEVLFPSDMQMEGMRYLLYGTPLPKVAYEKQLEVAKSRIKFLTEQLEALKAEKA